VERRGARPGDRGPPREAGAFTVDELQDFFDYADEQVTKACDRGRKGWLPAFRDATFSRSPTATACDATRPACSTSPTSAATRTLSSSETPADLIATKAENAVVRKTATDDGPVNPNARRPTRARLRPEA
jgi:hypothetical protein